MILLACGCGRIGFDITGGGNGDPDGGGGTGDGALGDGAMIDAAMIAGCGTTPILIDDFQDGLLDPAWTFVSGVNFSTSESGGTLAVAPPPSTPGAARAGVKQVATVSPAGICAVAELTAIPIGSADVYAYLRFGGPTAKVEIAVQNGMLLGRFTMGGSSGTSGSLAYNPAAHRFIRISHPANSFVFAAGPSLASFTMIGSIGGAIVVPAPQSFEIGAATDVATSGLSGTARFASVTIVGP